MTCPSPDSSGSEAAAVAGRYARRPPAGQDLRYSMRTADALMGAQEKQRAMVRMLSRQFGGPWSELSVLEIGCGVGRNLLELMLLGFTPANLVGNELLADRAVLARRNLPLEVRVLEGDAAALALPERSFDIVYQSTVFTSLLDGQFQRRLAERMWSWVKPGGGILWYDFIYDNPRNPDVRGVPIARIRDLFPAAAVTIRRITLAPPLSRLVCRVHPYAYHLFNVIPLLRTHVLCWIAKPS